MGNTKKPSLKPVIKRTFKELFGEVLNPLGFVFAKTKKPCFVRIVNGDIGHIVHLEDNGDSISIYSGVFTLYRNQLNLNIDLRGMDSWWMHSISDFYTNYNSNEYNNKIRTKLIKFFYGDGWIRELSSRYTEEDVHQAVDDSLKEFKRWVLPVLNSVNSLKEFQSYREKMNIKQDYYAVCDRVRPESECYWLDSAMAFAFEDPYIVPAGYRDCYSEFLKAEQLRNDNQMTEEKYQERLKKINDDYDKACELISYVMNNPEYLNKTKQELERRKTENIEILRTYGIDI